MENVIAFVFLIIMVVFFAVLVLAGLFIILFVIMGIGGLIINMFRNKSE